MVEAYVVDPHQVASQEKLFAKGVQYVKQDRVQDLLGLLSKHNVNDCNTLRDTNGKTLLMEAASNG